MKTKLIRSLTSVSADERNGVVTIGNFDGVHRGHQALLSQTIAEARQRGVCSIVMTFEPHPYEFFAGKNITIPRLTKMREKWHLLAASGVDVVLAVRFDQALATLTAEAFVEQYLYQALRAQHIVVGDDFRFGRQKQGDITLLEKLGQQYGFTVTAMPTFTLGGERVSSTRVKTALKKGDHVLVEELLGRPYTMMGRVSHGNKLGRSLGFPTANIHINRRLTPVHGIYTVKVYGLAPTPLPGVASIGSRPTIDGTKVLLEVYLLDFDADIYGRHVVVAFCEKRREEIRYANLDLLKAQIAKDVADAREYFKQNGVK